MNELAPSMLAFQQFSIPLFLIAALLAASAGLSLFIRYRTLLARWGGAFLVSVTVYLASYFLLLTNTSPGAVQFWFRIHSVAYLCLVVAWLFFVFVFTGHSHWTNWRTVILVGAFPALVAGYVLVHPGFGSQWISQSREAVSILMIFDRDFRLFGNLFVIYFFGIGFLSIALLVQLFINTNAYFRILIAALFVGVLLITLAGVLDVTGLNPFAPIGCTQLAYVVISMIAFFIVFVLDVGRFLPIARVTVFERIQDGVLVLDRDDKVIDLNPAAGQIIGHIDRTAVGRHISQVWPQGAYLLASGPDASQVEREHTVQDDGFESTFDVKISPVVDVNQEMIGRIVVLRDVTGRERMEKLLHNHVRELVRTNKLITALSIVASHLGNAAGSEQGLDILGAELKKLALDCAVVTIDPAAEAVTIKYVSINPTIVQALEKLTGMRVKNHAIPKRYWPDDRISREKIPVWYPKPTEVLRQLFPMVPESVAKKAFQLLGIQADGQLCFLPLLIGEQVIGVMPIWGADLQPADSPVLAVFASQVAGILQNAQAYESEARRARELAILLEASDATSSSLDFDKVLQTLAAQLLAISGFESCYISEWDKQTNKVFGILDHSRVFWSREKRDSYSLSDYPRSKEVLLTGKPIILQGDFEAEEKSWMDKLGRTAAMILALRTRQKTIGLVELANVKQNKLFDPQVLQRCQKILANAAASLQEPLWANGPGKLFEIESLILRASGADVCSLSEWDRAGNKVFDVAVSADITWAPGQGACYDLEQDSAWKRALYQGKASAFVRSEGDGGISSGHPDPELMDKESVIILPLARGDERIGLVELYHFNQEILVSPEQIALLRTIADKASYSIENARLLQLTQKRLAEKEVLLKEVHHRVKNNLQVISSLLNLQSAQSSDPITMDALRESQNRVRTMALIHEKLYTSTDLAQIDFAAYLQSLVTFLAQSYRNKPDKVEIQVDAQNIMLDIDTAIPCGLIVNELVSNSLKYAFPEDRAGSIEVSCHQPYKGQYVLQVFDDGVGLPAGFDMTRSPTLGLKLVTSLLEQLGGNLKIDGTKGARYQITFTRN